MSMEWKPIGKKHCISSNGKVYEYQIMKWQDGRKTIRFKGIVAYSEWQILKEKLSKKYKWLKV